jgi:hypothetical protein
MTIQLPDPGTVYLAADKLDGDAVARCFTSGAIVKDEGRTYTGVAAIKRWKTETAAKYTYTCEPLSAEQKDGTIIVTCHLEGNFPGGRADLRFFFRLERGKIAHLEIIP